MKVFGAVLFLGAILALIEMPEKILARPGEQLPQNPGPHEVWDNCGTWCEGTCEHQPGPGDSCIAMCKRGWFCEVGYTRETPDGRCILLSECPQRAGGLDH